MKTKKKTAVKSGKKSAGFRCSYSTSILNVSKWDGEETIYLSIWGKDGDGQEVFTGGELVLDGKAVKDLIKHLSE